MSSNNAAPRPIVVDVQAEFLGLGTDIDRLDGLAAERFGVNRTDLRALDLLRSAGALAPTALAHDLGFTTGGVTTVIDRLEAAGYVERRPDPVDRRRVAIVGTEALAEREGEVFGPLIDRTQALIDGFSDDQLVTVREFLRQARAAIVDHVDQLAARAAD
jgi:DNA-binding MarR family transcriptional regulator